MTRSPTFPASLIAAAMAVALSTVSLPLNAAPPGAGGYGPGPGMMPPAGMAPAMMPAIELTPDQRAKMGKIQEEVLKKQMPLMMQMREEMAKTQKLIAAGTTDSPEVKKQFERITELRKQMFDNMVEAKKLTESVLTAEQLDQLRRFWATVVAPPK